jgi:hypothetical protein
MNCGRGSFNEDIEDSGWGDHILGTLKDMTGKTLEMEHLSFYCGSVTGTRKDSFYIEDSDSHSIKGSGNGALVFIGAP